MKINVSNTQKALPLSKSAAKSIVKVILDDLGSTHSEVSLYFVSTKRISQLHDKFFQDPTPTDSISFPIDDEHLGDIFVCPETAINYAKKHDLDPYDETALYLIHGLLHCLGYDDLEPKLKKTMRKMEKRCMALIKKQNYSLRP